MCVKICPQVFGFDDYFMHCVIGDADVYNENVLQASNLCPTSAIVVEE